MKKLIVGALSAALAALMFAATALAEGTRRNPGYARFVPCPESNLNAGLTCMKEVVEIQRRATQSSDHAAGGIKAHPPEALEKPIWADPINCYIGCGGGHEFISATAASASAEICAGAEAQTQSKTHFSNERKQLGIATSCRAVSG